MSWLTTTELAKRWQFVMEKQWQTSKTSKKIAQIVN